MLGLPALARAQTVQGFNVERFYPSAAGGGWFVMDDLDLQPGFGGAIALTAGYARDPLVLSEGGQSLAVVSNQTTADISAAANYGCFRLSLDFPMPLAVSGHSGVVGGYGFTGPQVDLGTNPDSISDVRVGADLRLVGAPGSRFRFGLGAQLIVPSATPGDTRANYLTDGIVRAMFRALFAGDGGSYRYAAQLGVHVRPLNEWPIPGGPDGSELLFGAAIGKRFDVGPRWAFVVGPEVFGETAFVSFFGRTTTGVEGLLTGRFEGTGQGAQTRFKLGVGAGLDPQFGAPEWRIVLSVELFSNHR